MRQFTTIKLCFIECCIINNTTLWVFYQCLDTTYSCSCGTVSPRIPSSPESIVRRYIFCRPGCEMLTSELVTVSCNGQKYIRMVAAIWWDIHWCIVKWWWDLYLSIQQLWYYLTAYSVTLRFNKLIVIDIYWFSAYCAICSTKWHHKELNKSWWHFQDYHPKQW